MTDRCSYSKCVKVFTISCIPFRCKCDLDFCIKHRYAESHLCKFDYKEYGKKCIKNENPIVINEKCIQI